jgi:predicted deacylase
MIVSDPRALSLGPGTHRMWLGVGHSWFGPSRVPMVVVKGAAPGPKVVAVAAQHGDEGFGVLSLLDLSHDLDPAKLRGEVWLFPVLNLYAYTASVRHSPFDQQDMNRAHPGNPAGTATEQIAHALCAQVLPGADLVIDLHGGSPENGDIAFARWVDAPGKPSVLPLAQSLDVKFITIPGDPVPGQLTAVTPALGVPQLSIESGNATAYPRDNAREMSAFVDAALRWLGMIDRPKPQPRPVPFARTQSHRCTTGGAWKTLVSFGQTVEKGQRLGVVMDLTGAVVQDVISQAGGIVAVMRTGVRCHAGETLCTLGVPVEYTP